MQTRRGARHGKTVSQSETFVHAKRRQRTESRIGLLQRRTEDRDRIQRRTTLQIHSSFPFQQGRVLQHEVQRRDEDPTVRAKRDQVGDRALHREIERH